MTISSYLLEHVVAGTHLRDRLGMQRFIGSLLLAAWPPATISIIAATIGAGANSELPNRLNSCLTNVVYYEEILGEVVLPSTFLFVCMLAHRSLHSYVHPSRHLPIHPSINSSRAAYFPPPVSSIFSNYYFCPCIQLCIHLFLCLPIHSSARISPSFCHFPTYDLLVHSAVFVHSSIIRLCHPFTSPSLTQSSPHWLHVCSSGCSYSRILLPAHSIWNR